MRDTLTSDLAHFGARERALVVELLTAWQDHGLPHDFDNDEVVPMFNRSSGYVFLTNANYEVALVQGGELVSHYWLSYEGHEGTLEELVEDYERHGDTWHPDDIEQLEQIREANTYAV
jgi:hypothetical protein